MTSYNPWVLAIRRQDHHQYTVVLMFVCILTPLHCFFLHLSNQLIDLYICVPLTFKIISLPPPSSTYLLPYQVITQVVSPRIIASI